VTSFICRNLTRPSSVAHVRTGRYRSSGLLPIALAGLVLLAGCGGDDNQGPSDEQIKAEMEQILTDFQTLAKAEPDLPTKWFNDKGIMDELGLTGNLLVEYGCRMYADSSWSITYEGQPLWLTLSLFYMGTPEGAKKAIDLAAPDYPSTTALPEGITALRDEGALAFAYGPYYVIVLDSSEMPHTGYVPRDPAKAAIEAIKKVLSQQETAE